VAWVCAFAFLILLYLFSFAHANVFIFLASAASDTIITGWADATHTVYNEIGGYLLRLFLLLFSIVVLMLLILSFSLDHFRHNLRSMDYWKLLRVNLEHQSLVSLVVLLVMPFPFVCLLTFAFVGSPHGSGS
jgi:hypothetical protein